MKKLYEKSEITFAIMWIIIYTVCMGNLRRLGDDSPVLMISLIVVSALMFLCVRITGTMEYYGLTGWAQMPGLLYAAVMMAFVGFAEELIFRGFLFKAILKDGNARTAIIISSVTFGLGHILNLLIGQDLIETLVQIVFAVAVGFVFTMTFYKGGSLWPCILAHSVIDVTSVFFSGSSVVLSWIIHIIVFVLSIIYCIYLAKRVETPVINRVDMQQKEVFDPQ